MDFYQRMRQVCLQIPYGKAASYGQIALLCGKPRNARQVGYALGRGLAGKDVPVHRIVNAAGILSGASFFEYPELQKILLEEEGVSVIWTLAGWKVDLEKDGWKPAIDQAEELAARYRKMGI